MAGRSPRPYEFAMNKNLRRVRTVLLSLAAVCVATSLGAADAKKGPSGLVATFTSADGKTTDLCVVPNLALYVQQGKTPSPFVPEGKFTATWDGFISVDLRGDYTFQAELNGQLKIEIGTNVVLEATGNDSLSAPGKSIRLSKGTNAFKATFTPPEKGDAYVRLRWTPKGSFLQPVPQAALSHAETPELQNALKRHLGRELFVEHRCAKCHVGPDVNGSIPELAMDAPDLENIGARRNFEWFIGWIASPKGVRPQARMPRLYHGWDNTGQNALAISAYLSGLSIVDKFVPKNLEPADAPAGKKLFQTLNCKACHNDPAANENDLAKISLKTVAVKFTPNSLVDFLKKPDGHYAWIRMPTYKLSDKQRDQLAAFLFANSEKLKGIPIPTDKGTLEKGKGLVQTSGCLNCHALNLENKFSTKALADLKDFKTGCLAENPDQTKAPIFQFVAAEREALQAFLESDHSSLGRHVPAEFAERQTRLLNCRNCHEGQIEGIPHFDLLGGKLKPEWSAKFISGDFPEKMRPWLDAQMPAFNKRAELLAQGLSAQNGLPPQTPVEAAIDEEAAKVGNRLISAPPFGLSCIQCHSVGTFAATQVFEAPGVNLAFAGERLQPSFFRRWLRNPPLVDPSTKMPVYFDEEGKSPLTEIYDGDGPKQINAIWQYLRLGSKMPGPVQEK